MRRPDWKWMWRNTGTAGVRSGVVAAVAAGGFCLWGAQKARRARTKKGCSLQFLRAKKDGILGRIVDLSFSVFQG